MQYDNPFITAATEEFTYNKRLAERAFVQIDDRRLHVPLNGDTNSVAVILKHLSGNLTSRWTDMLTTDGEKPDRNRDGEFMEDKASREELIGRWEKAWGIVFATLGSLRGEDLEKTIYIRSEPVSVYRAILRQLAHCAYHVGQIVQVCRFHAGDRWEVITIPRGKSNEYLAAMREKFKR